MSTMALVGETVHIDHGPGAKCTNMMIHNVDDPANDGTQVDGAEIGLNLGIIIHTARNNVLLDAANSTGKWHYKGDCTR